MKPKANIKANAYYEHGYISLNLNLSLGTRPELMKTQFGSSSPLLSSQTLIGFSLLKLPVNSVQPQPWVMALISDFF